MHIPDGFLANRLAVSLDVLSGAGTLYCARRVKVDFSGRMVPVMGVLAAFVFAAQMLNFPILGGTSGHLIGGSLLAIILGPMAGSLTMTTVVIAQALFLQDGGLVALGANVFNISMITCFAGFGVYRLAGGRQCRGRRLLAAGFAAGWFSLAVSAACCALEMGISGAIPLRIGLPAMVGYHAIVGVVEGMLTAGVLSFLAKVRPDLLDISSTGRFGALEWIGAVLFVAAPAAILVLAGGSRLPDPLERLLPPVSAAAAEKLSSGARLEDCLMRAAALLLLVGIGFLAFRLARRGKSQP